MEHTDSEEEQQNDANSDADSDSKAMSKTKRDTNLKNADNDGIKKVDSQKIINKTSTKKILVRGKKQLKI